MLQQIYHHAIHDRYYRARDLLYNLNLQDGGFLESGRLDQEGQQLYNRAIIAISLAAFRKGNIEDSFDFVHVIFRISKLREIIGQTVHYQSGLQQEMLLPVHKHISIEIIEQTHWISCMLLCMDAHA